MWDYFKIELKKLNVFFRYPVKQLDDMVATVIVINVLFYNKIVILK